MKIKIDAKGTWFYVNAILVVWTMALSMLFWFNNLSTNWADYTWPLVFLLLFLPAHSLGLIFSFYVKMRKLGKRREEVYDERTREEQTIERIQRNNW